MKIAYILSQNGGGLPHYAAQLANAVADHADVIVLKPSETTADDVFADDVTTIDAFEPLELSLPAVRRLDVPVRQTLRGLYSYRNLRLIDFIDPDLVHDPTGLFPHAKLFASISGVGDRHPLLVTIHEVDEKRVSITQPVETAENVFDYVVPDPTLSGIIVHGRNQRDALRRSGTATPIDVIPHGTNDLFAEYEYEPRQTEPNTVLFFGNVLPEKGIDTLVEAIVSLRRRLPEITLVIAGDGRLPARSRELIGAFEEYFEVHDGFVPNDRVGEFFSRSALVALPYCGLEGREKGHSGVLATAYAFGKPVVATDIGNFPTLIGESGCGLTVAPNDPEALADAIETVLENDELRHEMSKASRKQAAVLSWEAVAEKHVDLYRRVIDDWGVVRD